MKKILTFLLTALLAFSVGWAETQTSTLTFTSACGGSGTADDGTTWTVTSDAAESTFDNTKGIHYGTSKVAVSYLNLSTTGISGTIKSIKVNASGASSTTAVLNVTVGGSAFGSQATLTSTATEYTFTGSANGEIVVRITQSSAKKALYCKSIVVTYETGGGTTVAPPTITPNGGNFGGSQVVTLSHDDADAIYYTTNGDVPTTSSTLYTAPFTITTTTTVKAIAVKDDVESSPATATFTNIGVGTIAEAYALAQGSQFIFTGNAVVTYQYNNFLWIRDGSGSGLIYGSGVGTYSNGDILNVGWSAKNTKFGSIPQFGSPSSVAYSSNSGTVTPFDRTSTGITTANVNEYVSFSNVTLSWDSSVGYCYYTVGNNKIYFRNNYFNNNLSVTSGHTYNIEGIAYIETKNNNNYPVVYLTAVTEVTSQNPLLEALPNPLTFNDSGTGNTITVTGSNLGGDNVGLTQSGSYFTPTLSASTGWSTDGGTYWYFTPNNGSLNGTVAMSYTGRELRASETVTLANNVASTTVTVNYRSDVYILGNYGSGWDYSNGILMTYDATNNTYTANVTVDADDLIVFARKLGESNPWNTRYLFGPNSQPSSDNPNGDWFVPLNGNGNGNLDLNNSRCIKFQTAGTYIIEIDANAGTFTITKQVVLTGDFTLVTAASQLAAGNEVIIVNSNVAGEGRKAMSTEQKTNNRGETDVTVKPTFTVTATDDTQIFTLEGSSAGWYFKTVNGDNQGYIYAASSAANYLKTEATADDNAKAAITIGNDSIASVVFQGTNTRNVLQHNSGSKLFSCYASASQKPVYLYQRSAAPSISVQPTLDLVIPAGETSANATVIVTETNVTGATTISSIDGDASNFNVTLSGTSLSVTYNGTATEDSPEEITINLVNGEATASITVTGYKVPLTVTISPANGATFHESSMNGTITANNEDAVIYYKTNEMSDFEVYNGSFTVTNSATENPSVQAYAVCGGETSATSTATYHHVTLSETLFTRVTSTDQLVAGNLYIIVYEVTDPLALHGEGLAEPVAWSGDNINIAGTSTTVFTLGGTTGEYTLYNVNYGYLTHDGKSTRYTQDANSLTIYGSETYGYFVQEGSYDLRYNTGENIDDPFRWYSTGAGTEAVLYVQGVEETPSLTLAELVETGVVNNPYTISNQLKAAKVTWDDNYGKFAIFAKDDEMYANKRYPTTGMDEYLIAFENQNGTVVNTVEQKDYDQSNWIEILIPSSVSSKLDNDYETELGTLQTTYENKILAAGTVSGTYKDALNPTIEVAVVPTAESSSTSTYAPNYYCTANFLQENLDADGAQSYRDDELAGGSYFMMDAKPQEFCKVVWAYYTGSGDVFVAPEREGDLVNGLKFRGSFKADMSLCEDKGVIAERTVEDCFAPSGNNTSTATLYGFNAIVRKNPAFGTTPSGAPNRIQAYTDGIESTPAYIVYPLNAGANSDGNVTKVNEVVSGKTVESVRFYNLMGVESDKPFEGVNIVVTRYTDGSRSTVKVLR